MVTGTGESFLTRMCDTRRDSSDICLVYIPLQSDLGLDRGTSRLVAETTHDPGVRWRPAFPTGSRIVEPVEGSTDGRVAVGDGWCFRSSWRLNADQMGAKRQAQKRPKQHWLGVLVPRLRLLRHTAHHGQDRVWGDQHPGPPSRQVPLPTCRALAGHSARCPHAAAKTTNARDVAALL